ncbi:uncharacterized protein TRIADDRAFT_24131 [Trichoplax adhaerens]|uniref:non-specific serine/threonine protein kinase n=1 Tax=Trichoplax adhaerens TaxID=10228 RepID=B3RVQ4_TRIAD|nr:hypothetical protein TRIADDRAFT_24131 [Trichoplax adhaerens]EDV25541.1 hypothetical protein TRIADDRAFT_24131 [Trichoplax adhaerens]|eukprot:XP_002111574.1 hypothetical protein TRIADDRAFT_24131 [Trichoplax adhaerens]
MKKLFSGQQCPYIGKVFHVGNYSVTVEELLAEGGFSLVFLVRCNRTGERYALKRLSVNNTQDLRSCQKEIRISKELSKHKNVITLLSSSINNIKDDIIEILLLMECCRVHVLQIMNQHIDNGLSEQQVLKIFCDICEAVSAMHHFNPPLIHRDLKVENILYRTQTNDYLLCDFGSAAVGVIQTADHANIPQLEEDIKRNTTLAYRAPEMIDLYSEKPISTKADIWALGCLLYKLCFYSLPFGENILAMQSGHFSIPNTSKYSKNLHKLIRFMLIVDPALRPDIFQVSYVAFKLAGLPCAVKNANVSKDFT